MRRVFWILITPLVLIFILGLIVDLLIFPKVTDWAINSAKGVLRKDAHVEFSVGETHMTLLRFSIFLDDVKIVPLADSKIPLQNIHVGQVQLRLDPLELLLGQLRLAAIVLDDLNLIVDLDGFPQNKDGPKALPINEIFKWSEKIPISRIGLRKSRISVVSKKFDIEASLSPLDVVLSNNSQRLTLRIYSPTVSLNSQRFAEPAAISLEALAILERRQLTLQSQMMSMGQTINLTSTLKNPSQLLIEPTGEIKVKISSDLKPLGEKLKNFISATFPELSGQAQLESEMTVKGWRNYQGRIELNTKDIKIGNFDVGDLRTKAQIDDQDIRLDEIKINHPAGQATLRKNSVKLVAPYNFKSNISVTKLDLQQLLQSLNLHRVPVWMSAQGEFPCEGQFTNFEMNCRGSMKVQDLIVKTGIAETEKVIVETPEGGAEGTLHVDLDKVSLKTQTHFGDGHGPVDGEVFYKKGFDFRFKTESLDFKNIKQLSGLDLKGETALDGFTRGDSKSAILNLNTHINNFVFNKYILGTLKGLIRYEKGHLNVSQIIGGLPSTSYKGQVDVDLIDSTLKGAFQFNKTDLQDVALAFQNIYKLPLAVSGAGTANVDFEGPFNFWKMSYHLTSQFRTGQLQGESFSNFIFNVDSHNGLIEAQQIEMQKGGSQIRMSGSIQPDQMAKLAFVGTNLRLEESELVNKIKNNLLGAFNFTGDLTGPIMNPDLTIKGHIAELIVDEQELPSSFFKIKLNHESIEVDANLFGNKIQGELKIPWGLSHQPLKIRAKTIGWNFASVLSLMGASQLQEEYESQLTSDIDLVSESGDWTAMTGDVSIKNIFLKRGSSSLKNPEPLEAKFNQGLIRLKKFNLKGPSTDIQIKGDDFSFNNLNIAISAYSDLRLVHILVPFLEDLGGPFQLQATLSGRYNKPEVLGNANVENTFVKIKGFPHPLEKLKADILFSHTKIVIQNIKGFIANGNITGDGGVLINGLKDFPTQIRIHAEGLNLNVPEKIKSQGDADLTFTGRWFPFVLGGVYNVSSALIEKEFTDSNSTKNQVRDSIYLPKVLKEAAFDPVLLDLQVNLQRNVQIKNSQMDGLITGQVQVKGPPANPILTGRINLEKSSKLMFKSNIFEVQTGNVSFNNPSELQAELYISAQSRVSDYDVNLLVQGPSSNPLIKLSSVPPLPDQEIISLLALGVTSQKLEQSQSRDQATRVGYEAGAVFLNQIGLNRGLQNSLGVNFELSSAFDNTKNVNVPRVTFRKKLSRKWSTSYSQGVESGQGPREVKLQYQINSNLSGVGSWESRDFQEGTSVRSGTKDQSIFGMDLEFKREFK